MMSELGEEIPWAAHLRWWAGDARRWRYVIEVGGERVGYVRLTPVYGLALLSIGLVREARGRGIGRRVLELIRPIARTEGFTTLRAEILRENTASQRAFMAAGWAPVMMEVGV